MEEYERDIGLFKDNTVLAQLKKKIEIDIDCQNPKKLANYTNQSCALYREATEIKTPKDACNNRLHVHMNEGWMMRMMCEQDVWRRGEEDGS